MMFSGLSDLVGVDDVGMVQLGSRLPFLIEAIDVLEIFGKRLGRILMAT